MLFTQTPFPDVLVIEPVVFEDPRGFFFEAYNERVYAQNGVAMQFLQDNQSLSRYGVVRGLHYQLEPFAQTKLVRALRGTIYDVIVDIRKGSPMFGKHFGIELSAENKKQLLVPKGFAHGFSVLSQEAEVMYKCDAFYDRGTEAGIVYNDVQLGIDWKVPAGQIIVSAKDAELPAFAASRNNFEYKG